MIKIGDFAKLARVSIKTLHHYGELKLLQPVHIDRFTGYRYYELEQLAVLNRILALKDLGFSLEQVAELLHESLSTAEMRGMLRLKQMELASRLEEEQSRLARVEVRLRQLEQGRQPLVADVALKEIPAQTVLMARIVAANESMLLPARQSLQSLLEAHLERAQLKPASPWFAYLNELPHAEEDLEIALAVGVNLRNGQRQGDWQGSPVELQALPKVPNMASLVHCGDYATLPQTYAALYAWMQDHSYQVAGSCREIYLSEDGLSAMLNAAGSNGLIEAQCPVEKTKMPASIHSVLEKREGTTMETQIVNKPAFKAIGLSYVGKNEQGEIPQMWGQFIPRINEPKRINPSASYGLCFSEVEGAAAGEFEYVAAVEVADDEFIPEGMVCREVPAHKYIVFTHHGKLETLGETYHYIYNTGLAQAGIQVHPSRFDMEVYTHEFAPDSDQSRLYIYVAIQ